ncbi:monogalactosyldiacylglycerol synthase, chloroplastic-like isoform X1 [Actinidia eriantha]|uniref:monogalactosyldiacylglycerol synthase, chloroplastic-like isoform X1 n=1 Tax=Actinidia eriantha TaxID=165200 RepID=UPI00258BAAAF|nr:monogalactosyldiacylglycerol synthase, chloroplastic-like isoform X1 [Actinidia eriantha]
MQTSSVSAQESGNLFSFVSRLGQSAFDSRFNNVNSIGYSSILPNYLYFDGPGVWVSKKRPRVVASLSLEDKSGSFVRKLFNEFNRAVRFHCEKIPIGFASVGSGSGDVNGLREDGYGVLVDEGAHLNGVEPRGPKKVLILMSDTGGGHRASAEAIKAAFNEEFGDEYQVFVTDLWTDHTPWPFNQLPRSYSFLVKHGPLWKMTYYASAPRVVHQSNFAATSTFIAREVAKGLMKYQPDIIISVHPLMQHVPLRILRAKGLLKKIVFTTVVTDLSTCHPTWFHKLVTRCYCPTEEVSKRALKAGLQPSQIKVFGLPVRPSFVKRVRPKDELRRELGMDEDLPAVLLMGGGEGMGPIEATARALGNTLYDENSGEPIGQVLVICGHNKKLANKLLSIDWKIPVQVKGFVNKMEECMGACDCIITKAGPGTIAEAMIRGLPIILNDYIAGQEAGNVPYVVGNGFGKFSKSPKETANIVAQFFGPKAHELKAMSQNALRLARPDAVFKIVHDLHELVREKNFVPQLCST